ncbi:hypothetical protein CAEBREN_26181 [Caenorhabditis brenneri]|uniref:SKP1 component dimerisation domain-containing protein n=1 Tax=Caenorhabditis brenneri TaxID=135651 RepID=G0NNZ1_CAEBE|nr:hypothetical protein CAEBREN_26181 [Caenorhabditis brenneri]
MTAVCATPNQARRVIKTADGQQLVLCASDVHYLSVIENMFSDLKALNGDIPEEVSYSFTFSNCTIILQAFVLIPISIESQVMYKIIEWSRAAKKSDESKLDFQQFFPDLSVKECIQILEASLFLETNKLGKCAAKWLAARLEGKTTTEMARILDVHCIGLSSEQQQKLNKFNLVTPQYID